jgi:hypothetical protein
MFDTLEEKLATPYLYKAKLKKHGLRQQDNGSLVGH